MTRALIPNSNASRQSGLPGVSYQRHLLGVLVTKSYPQEPVRGLVLSLGKEARKFVLSLGKEARKFVLSLGKVRAFTRESAPKLLKAKEIIGRKAFIKD